MRDESQPEEQAPNATDSDDFIIVDDYYSIETENTVPSHGAAQASLQAGATPQPQQSTSQPFVSGRSNCDNSTGRGEPSNVAPDSLSTDVHPTTTDAQGAQGPATNAMSSNAAEPASMPGGDAADVVNAVQPDNQQAGTIETNADRDRLTQHLSDVRFFSLITFT